MQKNIMYISLNIFLVFFLQIFNASPLQANENTSPAFDCNKATTAVEKTICSSDKLAEQDRLFNTVYKNAQKMFFGDDLGQFWNDQYDFLRHREECMSDEDCIYKMTNVRIEAISSLVEQCKSDEVCRNKKTTMRTEELSEPIEERNKEEMVDVIDEEDCGKRQFEYRDRDYWDKVEAGKEPEDLCDMRNAADALKEIEVLIGWPNLSEVKKNDDDRKAEFDLQQCLDNVDFSAFKNTQWLACYLAEYDKQKARREDEFKLLLSRISGQQRKALLKAERSWISFKEKWCAFEGSYDPADSDPIPDVSRASCLAEVTARHADVLHAYWR